MLIERCGLGDLETWARMRHELWPDGSLQDHLAEVTEITQASDSDMIALVCRMDSAGSAGMAGMAGFAEASVRRDYVNGCDTTPVIFLEGLYVAPEHRRQGVARALCKAVETWGAELGYTELGSDTLLDNEASQKLHSALGFEERERVVFFRKLLME